MQRTDLVVHDGTQAHDADVDIVLPTDQPRVFQCSPAGQCVTTEKIWKKREKKTCFNKKKCQVVNVNLSAQTHDEEALVTDESPSRREATMSPNINTLKATESIVLPGTTGWSF